MLGTIAFVCLGVFLLIVGRAALRESRQVHPQSAAHDAALILGWFALIGGVVFGGSGLYRTARYAAAYAGRPVVVSPRVVQTTPDAACVPVPEMAESVTATSTTSGPAKVTFWRNNGFFHQMFRWSLALAVVGFFIGLMLQNGDIFCEILGAILWIILIGGGGFCVVVASIAMLLGFQ